MNTSLKIILAALVIAALALGYRLYSSKNPSAVAKPGGTIIDISLCTAKPAKAIVKKGSDISFVNGNPVRHEVIFNENMYYEVPANSFTTVKADFGKGSGQYSFGCDKSKGPIGEISVIE